MIEHGIGINKEQHTVFSFDEEWWGEMIGSTAVAMATAVERGTNATELIVAFPITVSASHKRDVTAELLTAQGTMVYAGQKYKSPSGAGKVASGWKSVNGWTFWHFQHPETGEWQSIQALRARTKEHKD